MGLTRDIYDAAKKVMTIDARLDQVAQSVASVSSELQTFSQRVTAKLEEHSERLARLEGKFELIESTLASRPRRLKGAGNE